MPSNETAQFKLPLSIAQPVEVGHLIHELNLIDEHLNQAALRDPKQEVVVKPSVMLKELLEANKVDVNDKDQRSRLIKTLDILKKSAPVINVSLGGEASDLFISKLVQWFRREADPYCLIIIGLDPSIGIGSIVRTNNKVFNFSLRKHLKDQRSLLMSELAKLPKEANGQV